LAAAKALRRGRINLVHQPAEAEVEIRSFAAYDTAWASPAPKGRWRDGGHESVTANRDLASELVF
jgi:hypothetical protein